MWLEVGVPAAIAELNALAGAEETSGSDRLAAASSSRISVRMDSAVRGASWSEGSVSLIVAGKNLQK